MQRIDEKNLRILLMYITKVSGHRQATLSIQESLRKLEPTIEVPAINGFGYTYPLLEKIVHNTYMSVIKTTPQVWDYMYDNPKIVKKSQSIKKFLHKTSHEKIEKLFSKHTPDAVVCTQAFPCGMVADYKQEKKLGTKLIGVLTDFSPHSYWLNEGVDYYVVPSEEAKERFIQKGVNPSAIKVLGIPIRQKFSFKLDRSAIASQLGLNPNIPTVLIMGGGSGLGPMKLTLKSLIKVKTNFQIIVLSGTNKKIVNSLRRRASKSDKKILIYEFANNVDELMELADLIITKPGGVTTAECLAKGLPMIIVNPIPGQETRNTDFLIRQGIAIRIDDTGDIGEEVELLLNSPVRLKTMQNAAYKFAKPHASADIAKLILEETKGSLGVAIDDNPHIEKYV